MKNHQSRLWISAALCLFGDGGEGSSSSSSCQAWVFAPASRGRTTIPSRRSFLEERRPATKQTVGSSWAFSTSQLRLGSAEECDICVVGGGVAGLTAAWTAAQESAPNTKIIVVESQATVGGRVQSDVNDETGLILDRGFAVFIEEYPLAKQLLDYEALQLCPFLPGALVKIKDSDKLQRVADPLRQPEDLVTALLAAVGTLEDKIRVLPLIYHVRTKTIQELFDEPETDTLAALQDRWGFSSDMIDKFFTPFLEGIYLAPLNEQSSRMFSFVFKMFSEGAATLPSRGMGAVSKQLEEKAQGAGVDVRTGLAIQRIVPKNDQFLLKMSKGRDIRANKIILATDGPTAKVLLSTMDSLKDLANLPEQEQRFVGCLYYSFDGTEPVQDPILILNGSERGGDKNPVNNICFPSAVSQNYSPAGKGLCSVTVLKDAMESYKGRDDELDAAVRTQISTWFPDAKDAILSSWRLEKIYKIPNAQPAQLRGNFPANLNKGRLSDYFYGLLLYTSCG